MDDIFDDIVPTADLQKFEQIYNQQLKVGKVTKEAQFEYAYCLVRSKFSSDIQKGIVLMEELYRVHIEDRRDYLYYLAIGYARIKEFSKALNHCRSFLQIEPNNQQVLALEKKIQERLRSAGRQGMLVAGGGILAIGAAITAGILASKLTRS